MHADSLADLVRMADKLGIRRGLANNSEGSAGSASSRQA